MTEIKSYTDIEQSKKLAEILPLETADMCFVNDGTAIKIDANSYNVRKSMWKGVQLIPCWSLAALLEQIPSEICDDEGNSVWLSIYKENDNYQLVYSSLQDDFDDIETDVHEHFVDACVSMIESLHELNLF